MQRIIGSLVIAASISSCGFLSDKEGDKVSEKGTAPVQVAACAEITDPALKSQIDGLMAAANGQVDKDIADLSSKLDNGDLQNVSMVSPTAIQSYEQVLKLAPGHCEAQFRLGVAKAMNQMSAPKTNNLMNEMARDGNGTPGSLATVLGKNNSGAPELLYRTSAELNNQKPTTITEVQQEIESRILPAIDTAIAMVGNAHKQDNFKLNLTIDGRTRELGKSETGPVLAGLKVVKAYLVTIVSHNLEIAKDGNYGWMDTISNIHSQDFDKLSTNQRAALDHATGMFKSSSPLSKVKPEWKQAFASIPSLLEDAITNTQESMRFSIAEASIPGSQTNDPYIVGTGTDADVSPSELQLAIGHLDTLKQFLRGERNITINKGQTAFKVNIPKFFAITDGFQAFLPYHKILPYEQWNDTVSADTSWSNLNPYYLDNHTLSEIGTKSGMAICKSNTCYTEAVGTTPYGTSSDIYTYILVSRTYSSTNYSLSSADTLGTVSLARTNCAAVATIKNGTQKSFALQGCRVGISGTQVIDYVDAVVNAPFYFTDAKGNRTFNPSVDDASTPLDLKGKIVFPDPTFGGTFPDMTNDKLWTVLNDMEKVRSRTSGGCDEVQVQVQTPYGIQYDYVNQCTQPTLPENPSLLDIADYWAKYVEWKNNA